MRAWSRFSVFKKAWQTPLLLGLRTGVKQATRFRAVAKSTVSLAEYGKPLSAGHWTGWGARTSPNRPSTQAAGSMLPTMSRIISPLMPPPVVATRAMISRSWVSMANATWTPLPFQQGVTKPSEAQRWFDADATTLPSCTRMTRLVVLTPETGPSGV